MCPCRASDRPESIPSAGALLNARTIQLRGCRPNDLKSTLSESVSGFTHVFKELQELSRGIHPAILSTGGLPAGFKTLARRSAVPVNLDVAIEQRLPDSVEVAAYYVVAEALLGIDLYNGGGDSACHGRMANVRIHAPNRLDAVSNNREHNKNHSGPPEPNADAVGISPLDFGVHANTPPDHPNVCTVLEANVEDRSI